MTAVLYSLTGSPETICSELEFISLPLQSHKGSSETRVVIVEDAPAAASIPQGFV